MRRFLISVFFLHSLLGVNICLAQSASITSVEVYDQGQAGEGAASGLNIDVIQDACGSGPNAKKEDFFDTAIGIKIQNGTSLALDISGFRYRLRDENGARFVSGKLAPAISRNEILPKQESTLNFLFAKAIEGRKYFHQSATPIAELGFRNVTLILKGRYSNGKALTLKKRLAFSFGNENRC